MGHINKKLLPLKLVLVFLYASIGCLMPYLTIHMYHIGLSHEEVTWINTALPLTALIGPALFGYLADKSGNYRLIIIISMLLAGIFHTALLFVPEASPPHKPTMQMVCGPEGSSLVLQSCTGKCSKVNSKVQGSFKISNCRQECDIQSKSCRSFPLPHFATKRMNASFVRTDAEIHTVHMILPNICFHDNSETKCKEFGYSTYTKINITFDASPDASSRYFQRYDDCCEYPFNEYYTESSALMSNLTCNTLSDCHIICEIVETLPVPKSNGYSLQHEECLEKGNNPKLTFWLYFFLRSVADMFPAILISIFDAVALTMVTTHGGDYGRQKMFGLFALGASAPLVGYLMDRGGGVYGRYMYAPVFYVFDVLMLLAAIVTFTLPLKVEVQKSSMMKNLCLLIRTFELNLLFFIVTILGLFYGYLETFLYVHLVEDLSASKLLLGFTITMGILPSVPFLYKSESIIKYCGHHYLLILAFVAYSVRFAGLSYLRNPLWVIPIEVLELFTLNLMGVASATLAYKLAPKSLVVTAQSLVWLSHFDVGRALGTIIGGYLIKIYGRITVFQMASVFSAICAILYLSFYQLFKYFKAKRSCKNASVEVSKENRSALSNGKNYLLLPAHNAK